jgi:hypothetical protein
MEMKMPLTRIEPKIATIDASFAKDIADELRRGRELDASPSPSNAPEIIEEVTSIKIMHVTVIWDTWMTIPMEDRARIIMDAYRAVGGDAEARSISVALGLTHQEAARLGIIGN